MGKIVRSVWISSVFALCSCSDESSTSNPQAAGAAATSGSGAAGLGSTTAGAAPVGSAGTSPAPIGSAGMPATAAGAPAAMSGSAGTSATTAGTGAAPTGIAGAASTAGTGATAGTGSSPSGAPTFTRVWNEILMLKGCSGQYCHGSGMGGLKLKDKREAYDNLVNVAAAGPACAAKRGMRVKPMDPDASLLLDKLSHATPSCGEIMPIGAKLAPNCVSTMPQVCTTEAELGLVRAWILAGARDD